MYIDPSSGGLLFQVLLIAFGLISGAVLVFSGKIKMGFARLMRSFRERSNQEQDPENRTDVENSNQD
jgi:hypothetical protein